MRVFMLLALRILTIGLLLTLVSDPVQANRLDRTGQCRPGQLQCGRGCCPAGQRCSFDGRCIPPGHTYCGGGRTCGPFERCVAGGARCAPAGANTCRSRLDCPGDSFCNGRGECERTRPNPSPAPDITPPAQCADGQRCGPGSACLPGGGCSRPGWFLCEETGSQCRPGFKCSKTRGCVPAKAVDCGNARWCKPGERCLPEGGCEKLPQGQISQPP